MRMPDLAAPPEMFAQFGRGAVRVIEKDLYDLSIRFRHWVFLKCLDHSLRSWQSPDASAKLTAFEIRLGLQRIEYLFAQRKRTLDRTACSSRVTAHPVGNLA